VDLTDMKHAIFVFSVVQQLASPSLLNGFAVKCILLVA